MEVTQTIKSGTKRRTSEKDISQQITSGPGSAKRRRHSAAGHKVDNGAPLELNRMELRSGKNLLKCAADSTELTVETSPLVENVQTPKRKSSQTKNRGKSMQIETSPLEVNVQTPNGKSSQTKNRRKSMQIATSPLVVHVQTPNRKYSQNKNGRKSVQIVSEQLGTPTTKENAQTQRRKSVHFKRSLGKENEEPVVACTFAENSLGRKSSETEMNRSKSKGDEENEVEFIDLSLPPQEYEVSSTRVIENVEINDDLSVPIEAEEDVAEILNSTFEVAEEDSILQTPARKRSVRFATSVETRRRTASLPDSGNNNLFSTPVSMSSKKRSSQHKGTPHPSAKKQPGISSILKTSSSKKFPSSSKDNSLKGKLSARKMPDFSSIHKAQFEKMESIDEFNRRHPKCARKLEAQAVDSKEDQLKPSAVVKPLKRTAVNALSRIPVVPRNTSKPGTPRAFSGSHIPVTSFRVLTAKNFDSRLSAPQSVTSRASITKIGSNSRPKPVNKPKPQHITYEQAKATILHKRPLAAAKREAQKLENRSVLKGVRLNRRFELQMQHRNLNM